MPHRVAQFPANRVIVTSGLCLTQFQSSLHSLSSLGTLVLPDVVNVLIAKARKPMARRHPILKITNKIPPALILTKDDFSFMVDSG